jgi:hypothetical protein
MLNGMFNSKPKNLNSVNTALIRNRSVTVARRRYLYADAVNDQHVNELSRDARDIWWRLVAVSDDCGVTPAEPGELQSLINCPMDLRQKLPQLLEEIAEHLGFLFDFRGKRWFCFKPETFEYYQSHLLSRRTKSEYLKIRIKEFHGISQKFTEFPGNSSVRSGSIGTDNRYQDKEQITATAKAQHEIPGNSVKNSKREGFKELAEIIGNISARQGTE